ncbi:lysozyme-like domain-containing protein [Obelidium mucronatum]|nr:lysozyme-like domain-containing protein [Obelidium mucronatum]
MFASKLLSKVRILSWQMLIRLEKSTTQTNPHSQQAEYNPIESKDSSSSGMKHAAALLDDDSSSDVYKQPRLVSHQKTVCFGVLGLLILLGVVLLAVREKLNVSPSSSGTAGLVNDSISPLVSTQAVSAATRINTAASFSSAFPSTSTSSSSSTSTIPSTTTTLLTTTTTITTTESPIPPAPKSGTIASLVSRETFDRAVSYCTGHWGMYDSVTSGFSAPLAGGLPELSLLLGNLAWESGGFSHTKEQACQDGSCAYGWYYGRGYLQLTWQANYQAAADFLGRPEIASNPDLVSNDEYTNWQVVEWYWMQKVSPVLQADGFTIGASVKAINGGIECGGNVWGGRINFIQCFANQLGSYVDSNSWC